MIKTEIIQTKEGFWVIKDDLISTWIEQQKKIDIAVPYDKIYPHLGDGIVLDIGANIGSHTYAYAKIINPKNIVAIEPNSEHVKCLKKNIPDCHVLELGISDKIGTVFYNEEHSNMGASFLSEDKNININFIEGIKVYPLDYLWDTIKILTGKENITFIKMDIEGWELKALKGATNLLKEQRPKLWMEVCNSHLKRTNTTEEELYDYIYSIGYKIEPHPHKDIQYDILCIPV